MSRGASSASQPCTHNVNGARYAAPMRGFLNFMVVVRKYWVGETLNGGAANRPRTSALIAAEEVVSVAAGSGVETA